jgi:hypothetical protein
MKWMGMNSTVPKMEQVSTDSPNFANSKLTELSVYSADQLIYHGSKILILLDVLSRWYRNLDKHNFANPLRMLGQEDLERMQLLWDAFDVIESINTNNQLDALELSLQRCNALLNFGLLQSFIELLWVNADGKGTNMYRTAFVADPVGSSWETSALG